MANDLIYAMLGIQWTFLVVDQLNNEILKNWYKQLILMSIPQYIHDCQYVKFNMNDS